MEVSERSEYLTPAPAEAFAAMLGVPLPDLANGEPVPLLWHWLYLMERTNQVDLGPDGHPIRNVIPLPPRAGLRRMWAGGRVERLGPLHCGQVATRRSRVVSVTEKVGKSGPLVLVEVQHRIVQAGRVVIEERQDIVYREPVAARPQHRRVDTPGASGTTIPPSASERSIEVTPPLLFRFSALTYNSHRIHYDRDYATSVEGYRALVVHGPLQTMAMAEFARSRFGTREAIEYRMVAPLLEDDGFVVSASADGSGVSGGHVSVGTRDSAGRRTATGMMFP